MVNLYIGSHNSHKEVKSLAYGVVSVQLLFMGSTKL